MGTRASPPLTQREGMSSPLAKETSSPRRLCDAGAALCLPACRSILHPRTHAGAFSCSPHTLAHTRWQPGGDSRRLFRIFLSLATFYRWWVGEERWMREGGGGGGRLPSPPSAMWRSFPSRGRRSGGRHASEVSVLAFQLCLPPCVCV